MAGFIEFDFEDDPEEWVQRALDALALAFPGWQPNEAHLEVALVEELARIAAESAQVATDVPAAIFQAFGEKLVGLAPKVGVAATAEARVTMVDAAGYTLPAGTVVAFRTAEGEYELWRTLDDAVALTGTAIAPDITLEADDVGTARNGLPVATSLELVDSYAFVESIELTTASAGGVDAETDEEYLDRLADELTLLTPTPILAEDFALLARRTEGVHRALAINGYNPADQTLNNERMVTVVGLEADGDGVAQAVEDTMRLALDALREVNFVVNSTDPTHTRVDVVFEAVAEKGYVAADVEAAAEAAVAAFLDPATWGDTSAEGEPPVWEKVDRVRLYEVAAVLNAVDGLNHVTLLTLGLNGGAQAAADVVLSGIAPLPSRVGAGGTSTVAGTVVAP